MPSMNSLRPGGFRTSFETKQSLVYDQHKETPCSGLVYKREVSSIDLAIYRSSGNTDKSCQ